MNVRPNGYSSDLPFCMRSTPPAGSSVHFDFEAFNARDNVSRENTLWLIESYEKGYSIKAIGIEGENVYLNINASGTTTLGERQELTIAAVTGGFQISRVSGSKYYVRFTNSYKIDNINTSCFVSSTGTVSSTFIIYQVVKPEEDTFDQEEPRLFTIAAVSDLHTDYGIQEKAPYIRQGFIELTSRIKAEENADVLLIGGDITSRNDGSYTWTKEKYDRAMASVYDYARSATQSGKVLYATGNHDFVAGGNTFNSGDYTAVMLQDIGTFNQVLYQNGSKYPHVLSYYYSIDQFDFIVLNTPYLAGDNHSNYVYDDASISWLDQTLSKIGNKRTVFVMGHYPLRDSRNISSESKGVSTTNNCNDKLKAALVKHRNVIYLYGHDHGGHVLANHTFERITPYTVDGKVINNRKTQAEGFVSSFMGSVSYYKNSLSSGELAVKLALLLYIYSDKITFKMKNYGISHAGNSEELMSYTIHRDNTQPNTNNSNGISTKSITTEIYPNPARSSIKIKSNSLIYRVSVTDVLGRTVYNNDLDGNNQHTISISTWSDGIYIVKIQGEDGYRKLKFMKN